MAPNLQFCAVSHITSKDEAGKRLNDEVKAYKDAEGSLFITQAAYIYVVSKATLYRRINSCRNQVSHRILKQRLTPEEKESIKNRVLGIQSSGFPPRVAQLREMAVELLQAKDDYKELGINYVSGYLSRHLTLQAKYSRTLDQDRFFAQNQDIIQD